MSIRVVVADDEPLVRIRMPHLDGLEALRLIGEDPALVGVRVVVLTTFDLDEYVVGGAAGDRVSRAMVKLGARDRAQMVVIAYQSGLVS